MTSATELMLLVTLQIAVHLSTCLALLLYVIAFGLRPDRQASPQLFDAFWACVLYCAGQFVLWGINFVSDVQPTLELQRNGFEFIFRFVWSPQLSIIVLWFFFAHVVQSCPHMRLNVPRSSVVANFRSKTLSRAFTAGVLGVIIANSILPLDSFPPRQLVATILAFSVVSTAVELILKRYKYRQMSLVSPTVSWLYGVWLGAWVIAAL